MAEKQLLEIKALYGELSRMLIQIPNDVDEVKASVGRQYNSIIDELNVASDSDYSRQKVTPDDYWNDDEDYYDPVALKTKLGALVGRLEEQYGFGSQISAHGVPPVVITVTQNQQVNVAVVPIQSIIDTLTYDPELKKAVEDLKNVLETTKDKKTVTALLTAIMNKSWDVFIALLPAVLQSLGGIPSA